MKRFLDEWLPALFFVACWVVLTRWLSDWMMSGAADKTDVLALILVSGGYLNWRPRA